MENNFFLVEKIVAGKKIGKPCIYFENVTSTNDMAKKFRSYGEGVLIVAGNQTKGRGRGDHTWESTKFKNLTFSFTLKPEKFSIELLSLVVGLSVREAIETATELSAKLKWPNDILIHNKKVSGTLVEVQYVGQSLDFVVVGIGINVNQEKFVRSHLKKIEPTSLKNESGQKNFQITQLLSKIISSFEKYYDLLKNGKTKTILNLAVSHLSFKHRNISFLYQGVFQKGFMEGLDEKGKLCVRLNNGKNVCLSERDVTNIMPI